MLDVDRCEDIDAGGQDRVDVLPALRTPAWDDVAVGLAGPAAALGSVPDRGTTFECASSSITTISGARARTASASNSSKDRPQ